MVRKHRQWVGFALLAVGLVVGSLSGCHKTFRGNVNQPNPLIEPNETLRISERVVIVTGDMELQLPRGREVVDRTGRSSNRYPLLNAASFTVVSRDRLRFHVQIEHKWREWADLSTWDAYLVDDQGHRYQPEVLERNRARHLVSMWDYETRTAVRNRFGDIVYVMEDGYKRRKPLGTLSVFRGRGDFVFYSRDIFTPDIKRLTLVLERTGMAFSFTWTFADGEIEVVGPAGRLARTPDDAGLRVTDAARE